MLWIWPPWEKRGENSLSLSAWCTVMGTTVGAGCFSPAAEADAPGGSGGRMWLYCWADKDWLLICCRKGVMGYCVTPGQVMTISESAVACLTLLPLNIVQALTGISFTNDDSSFLMVLAVMTFCITKRMIIISKGE